MSFYMYYNTYAINYAFYLFIIDIILSCVFIIVIQYSDCSLSFLFVASYSWNIYLSG